MKMFENKLGHRGISGTIHVQKVESTLFGIVMFRTKLLANESQNLANKFYILL